MARQARRSAADVRIDEGASAAMRRLNVQELRARQLRVLDVVTEHCRRFGITYYLCAGTLLGAVRHQGFIPWDDDIDVMMPRPDYERFTADFGRTGEKAGLTVVTTSTHCQYELPFAKVSDDSTELRLELGNVGEMGVYIDVFPLDGWFPNGFRRRLQSLCMDVLYKLMQVKHPSRRQPRGPISERVLELARWILVFLPGRALANAITAVASRPGYHDSADVGVLVWGYRETVPRASYGACSTVVFEGRQLPAPRDPDDVLRRIYGDYMTLPPEHQRVTHHHRFEAYARDQQE